MNEMPEQGHEAEIEDGLTDDFDLSDLAQSLTSDASAPVAEDISSHAPGNPETPGEEGVAAEDLAEAFSGDTVPGTGLEADLSADDEDFIDLDDILEESSITPVAVTEAWAGEDLFAAASGNPEEDVLDLQFAAEPVEEELLDLAEVGDPLDGDAAPLDLGAVAEPLDAEEELLDLGAVAEPLDTEEDFLDLGAVAEPLDTEEELLDLGAVAEPLATETDLLDLGAATESLNDTDDLMDLRLSLDGEAADSVFSDDATMDLEREIREELAEEAAHVDLLGTGCDGELIFDADPEPGTEPDVSLVLADGEERTVAEEAEMTDADLAVVEVPPVQATPDAVAAGISQEDLEAALERVVRKVFAEKIDAVLVHVIEQAVEKEIGALKDALFAVPDDRE